MVGEDTDILDDLVAEICEEIYESDNYNPDRFYEEAVDFLSVYGYNLDREVILEVEQDENDLLEDDHLEIITELEDMTGSVYLRFVLEDGRPGKQPPVLNEVDSPDDFDLPSNYKTNRTG